MMTRAMERLFDRLAATYGAAWERSLGGSPIADVKTIWAHELSGFETRLYCVAWALENLPERAPNVIEFRNLCRSAPSQESPLLPEPKADPARVAAEMAKLSSLRSTLTSNNTDMKAWAYRLKARDEQGEKLSRYQRECYRTALGMGAL